MTAGDFDLSTAESIYAVSNAPLYLLRKLKADAATRAIARSMSIDEISDAIEKGLNVKPHHLREAVEPYVLLAALQMKEGCTDALKKALALPAPYHDWFSYLAEVSLQMLRSTNRVSFDVGRLIAGSPTTNSTAANTAPLIIRP